MKPMIDRSKLLKNGVKVKKGEETKLTPHLQECLEEFIEMMFSEEDIKESIKGKKKKIEL